MQTYTVHEKRLSAEEIDDRADNLVFIREGFTFLVLFVPALWFLFQGLWRALFLYILLSLALMAGLGALGVSETVMAAGGFILNVMFAFEARDMQRAKLERGGYVLRAVVSGRSLEECERRFIAEWLPAARRERERQAAAAAKPAEGGGGPATSVPVIGMFPSHGG